MIMWPTKKLRYYSPSGSFYCIVLGVSSLNISCFGIKCAIYDSRGKLIYQNKGQYAHELHTSEEISTVRKSLLAGIRKPVETQLEFIWWSSDEKMAYLLEYGVVGREPYYTSTFILLREVSHFQHLEIDPYHTYIDKLRLENNFDSKKVIDEMRRAGIHASSKTQ